MPLELYQQLRIVGVLFTEKRHYIPIFTTIKTSFTYGHEGVTGGREIQWQQDELEAKVNKTMSYFVPSVSVLVVFFCLFFLFLGELGCEKRNVSVLIVTKLLGADKITFKGKLTVWKSSDWSYSTAKVISKKWKGQKVCDRAAFLTVLKKCCYQQKSH